MNNIYIKNQMLFIGDLEEFSLVFMLTCPLNGIPSPWSNEITKEQNIDIEI
jgi:hypothetical protein